jgi:hypothetical protein
MKGKICRECGGPREGRICPSCGHEELRGGARSEAGREKNEPDFEDIKVGKGFATRVFARIKELGLRGRVDETDPDLQSEDGRKRAAAEKRIEKRKEGAPRIRTAEDYALEILRPQDGAARQFFKDLLLWQLGKPVQPVITADTRETAPELDFGNLVMQPSAPASAGGKAKPGAAGKPN